MAILCDPAGRDNIYYDSDIRLKIVYSLAVDVRTFSLPTNVFYSLNYANALNCKGEMPTFHKGGFSMSSSFDFCHLYRNEADRSVISRQSSDSGLLVGRCSFKDNLQNHGFSMDLYFPAPELKFQVSNCFFSAPDFPSNISRYYIASVTSKRFLIPSPPQFLG
jgi:hypothetical protein